MTVYTIGNNDILMSHLVLSVGSDVPVFSVVGSLSSIGVTGTGGSDVVVSLSGSCFVRVESTVSVIGSSVGTISSAAGSMSSIGVSSGRGGHCRADLVAGHRVGLSCHHVFGQSDGQQSGEDEELKIKEKSMNNLQL